MVKRKISIVWFKRDLRVSDHAPLWHAVNAGHSVIPLYIDEPDYWALPDMSYRHWHFVHECLVDLNQDLTRLGAPLIIRQGKVIDVFQSLHDEFDIQGIYTHEETGNMWTYRRDLRVLNWCKHNNVTINEYQTNGVVRRLKSRDDWSKIRNMRMSDSIIPTPDKIFGITDIQSDDLRGKNNHGTHVQRGGRIAANKILNSFFEKRVGQYLYNIANPIKSEKTCSRLSPHLTWGTLSSREILYRLYDLKPDMPANFKRHISAFEGRLAWRCHFVQKIEDQPEIETHCMHPAFETMRDGYHNDDYFNAWKNGQTGYPYIDACMRYLIHNGWISFRMRAMLVSFASYHLWLDWRVTAPYLAGLFTDYEPGIHYSQFQMQSGVTGINAIRIYNPIKQSQDHDAEGDFIRQWVPELRGVSDMWIHEPWKNESILGNYPKPIVDHATATKFARAELKKARNSEEFRATAKAVYNKLGSRNRPPSRRTVKKNDDKRQGSLF